MLHILNHQPVKGKGKDFNICTKVTFLMEQLLYPCFMGSSFKETEAFSLRGFDYIE